MIKKTGHVSIT